MVQPSLLKILVVLTLLSYWNVACSTVVVASSSIAMEKTSTVNSNSPTSEYLILTPSTYQASSEPSRDQSPTLSDERTSIEMSTLHPSETQSYTTSSQSTPKETVSNSFTLSKKYEQILSTSSNVMEIGSGLFNSESLFRETTSLSLKATITFTSPLLYSSSSVSSKLSTMKSVSPTPSAAPLQTTRMSTMRSVSPTPLQTTRMLSTVSLTSSSIDTSSNPGLSSEVSSSYLSTIQPSATLSTLTTYTSGNQPTVNLTMMSSTTKTSLSSSLSHKMEGTSSFPSSTASLSMSSFDTTATTSVHTPAVTTFAIIATSSTQEVTSPAGTTMTSSSVSPINSESVSTILPVRSTPTVKSITESMHSTLVETSPITSHRSSLSTHKSAVSTQVVITQTHTLPFVSSNLSTLVKSSTMSLSVVDSTTLSTVLKSPSTVQFSSLSGTSLFTEPLTPRSSPELFSSAVPSLLTQSTLNSTSTISQTLRPTTNETSSSLSTFLVLSPFTSVLTLATPSSTMSSNSLSSSGLLSNETTQTRSRPLTSLSSTLQQTLSSESLLSRSSTAKMMTSIIPVTTAATSGGDNVVPFWAVVILCLLFTVILSLSVIFVLIFCGRWRKKRKARIDISINPPVNYSQSRKSSTDNTLSDGGESNELQLYNNANVPMKKNNSNDSLDSKGNKVGLWWNKGSSKPVSSQASIGTSTLKRNQQLVLPHVQVELRAGGEVDIDSRPSSIFTPVVTTAANSRPGSMFTPADQEQARAPVASTRPAIVLPIGPIDFTDTDVTPTNSRPGSRFRHIDVGDVTDADSLTSTPVDKAEVATFSAFRDTDIKSMLEKILQSR